MARECCPRAFDAVFKHDLYGVFEIESDELPKVFDFPSWRKDLDVHTLDCCRDASSVLRCRIGDDLGFRGVEL